LVRRLHEAKVKRFESVEIWGTGNARREFLYVDDMAAACLYVMNLSNAVYSQHTQPMISHINVGFGEDITIKELATVIASVVGFHGKIVFDPSMPDGAPRKLMDSSKINSLGWHAEVPLRKGLEN